MFRRPRHYAVVCGLFVIAYALVATWVLHRSPGQTFFAGDMGQKYIFTRSIAESGPFKLTMPEKPAELHVPGLPLDMFVLQHNGRLYPIFSYAFALLNAPLYRAFGYDGLFFIPALSIIATLCIVTWFFYLKNIALTRTALALAFVLATPVSFYGFTFWEHGPGIALCTLSLVLVMMSRKPHVLIAAGITAGLSCLFRAEGILFAFSLCLALLVTRGTTPALSAPPWRALLYRLRTPLFYGLAFCVGWIPTLALNLIMSGRILGPQWYYNRNKVATLAEKLALADLVFAGVAVAGLLVSLGAVVLLFSVRRRLSPRRFDNLRAFAGIVVLVVAVYLPPLHSMLGQNGFKPFDVLHTTQFYSNLFFTAPPLCAGLLFLATPRRSPAIGARLPVITAVVVCVLFAITATTSGGLQWGPRLLMSWMPVVAALAALRMDLSAWLGRSLVVLILVAALWQEAAALQLLQKQRMKYNAMQDALVANTEAGGIVVTNRGWLYLETPELFFTRTLVRIRGPEDLARMLVKTRPDTPVHVVFDGSNPALLDVCQRAAKEAGYSLESTNTPGFLRFYKANPSD